VCRGIDAPADNDVVEGPSPWRIAQSVSNFPPGKIVFLSFSFCALFLFCVCTVYFVYDDIINI